MSCLMAKSKNIKRTIAIVDNTDYFELSVHWLDTRQQKTSGTNEIFNLLKGQCSELNIKQYEC